MKKTQRLWHSVLGLLLVATGAAAAPASDSSGAENIYSQLDPDGIPLSVTQGQPKKPTQAEIDDYHKQVDQAALNKNWLLRSYEHQKELRNKANGSSDQTANLYFQISSNKALAKLAGLPEAAPNGASLKTGADSGASSAALRKDPALDAARNPSSINSLSRPLIAPLSSNPSASNFGAPPPLLMTSPFGGILPQASSPASTRTAQSLDTSDLETPGMTAEKTDPLAGMSSADLTLDILPGESIQEARAHQDNFKAELSLPMDADQLHKQQTAATKPTTVKAPTAKTADTTAPQAQTKPEDDPNAPMPVSQVPQINPVRAPIANPFDILHR
jgi:hypothetical protein